MTDHFLYRDNSKLVTDVLLDHPIISSKVGTALQGQHQFRTYIADQMDKFVLSREASNASLVDMNKVFIDRILLSMMPEQPIQQTQPKNMTQMFEGRQQDFVSSMKLKPPQNVIFKDGDELPRLTGDKMEELIAATVAQRNFDISKTTKRYIQIGEAMDEIPFYKGGEKDNDKEKEKDTNLVRRAVSWADDEPVGIFSQLKLKAALTNEDLAIAIEKLTSKIDIILSRLPDVLQDIVA